ncbi:MAG: hypothetical protein PHS32_14035 [Rhodoferax sp.]|uniref:hypothetical protein n=1 Tax=Rhodoferax sp. TaxID=50421 RepID=UPI00260B6C01|nr:hypothetical protein [Rhodoferax sp.]MDD5334849.1 hypothetical protein [Rhodoferax sp.]
MSNSSLSIRILMTSVFVTALAACGGNPAPQVAAADTVVPVTAATVKAAEAVPFSVPAGAFPASVPALATVATTVKFTNTTSATPTATITAPGGTVTGITTFGSCIFTVTASTLAGVTVGQVITVHPCQINVETGGVQATGQATTVHILLQLGQIPSAPAQASVSIDPTTGVVTVNGVNGGTVTLKVTGAQ